MLIVKTQQGPQHGYRLERQGWVRSDWKQTESNQRAKVYRITATGKKQLAEDLG